MGSTKILYMNCSFAILLLLFMVKVIFVVVVVVDFSTKKGHSEDVKYGKE